VEWRRTLLELCLDMLQTSRPRPGQTMVIGLYATKRGERPSSLAVCEFAMELRRL
jgi:hypothetical protein